MNSDPFILLHPDDNVLVCRQHAVAGQQITLDGDAVVLSGDITVGHKIARRDLKAGEKIIKYGAPIGSMKTDAPRGAHIHMHNMQSDYIKSHTREVTGHGH
ncbi:MAG: UxaA family hydrolase [Asticcacaulis sp.]|uniref:UxaA family hydrolase n=1 Tax=Asticcacaulis sp. TaxID=1872648 RepID=UPI0039E31C32